VREHIVENSERFGLEEEPMSVKHVADSIKVVEHRLVEGRRVREEALVPQELQVLVDDAVFR